MAKAKTETTTMHPKLKALIDDGIPLEYVFCTKTVRSGVGPEMLAENSFFDPDCKRNGMSPTSIKTRLAKLYLTQAGIVIQRGDFLTFTSLSNAHDYKPL